MQEKLIYPTIEEMDQEIERLKRKSRVSRGIRWTLYSLVVVAAIVVLIATLWMPVLKITGNSMSPTLHKDELVVAIRTKQFQSGDVIAFYYDNKILIKRVIATAGQYVDIKEDGTVLVNGKVLDEPYIQEKSKGECDIQLPYQVGDGQIFVMGDDRAISLDSRTTAVGTIEEEKVLGRVVLKVWPWASLGQVR
ncbi:signal peptidase I [Faecalimonas sp.]